MNKCRIHDEDNMAISAHYKIASEKNNGKQYRGKSYVTSADKEK